MSISPRPVDVRAAQAPRRGGAARASPEPPLPIPTHEARSQPQARSHSPPPPLPLVFYLVVVFHIHNFVSSCTLVHFGAVVSDAPSPLSTPRSAAGQAQLRLG